MPDHRPSAWALRGGRRLPVVALLATGCCATAEPAGDTAPPAARVEDLTPADWARPDAARTPDDAAAPAARVESLTSADWATASTAGIRGRPTLHVAAGAGGNPFLLGTLTWHPWSAEGSGEVEWGPREDVAVAARFIGYSRGESARPGWVPWEKETFVGRGVAIEGRWYAVGPRDRHTHVRRPLLGLVLGVGIGGALVDWHEARDKNGNLVIDSGEVRSDRGVSGFVYGTFGYAFSLGRGVRFVPHLSAGAVTGRDPWGGWFHVGGRLSVGF